MKKSFYPDQVIPLLFTITTFVTMFALLYCEIFILNSVLPKHSPIFLKLRIPDIIVGVTIYLKTSIDFAILIGRLMSKFPGWKNRIMIEVGTALGNAIGTMAILILWDLFREIKPLMAVMIVIAALVLFRLAEEGLDHVKDEEGKYLFSLYGFAEVFEKILSNFNRAVAPILNRLIPKLTVSEDGKAGLKAVFLLAFSIPFLLGLDDFAGYLPLFNIINVFGFAAGVFAGHMILNIFLFLSPRRTAAIVMHPVISFFGSVAFVGLGIFGI